MEEEGAKSAVREGDARIARGEMGDLLPPRQLVAAEPVRKHDRGPCTRYLVVDDVCAALKAADAAGGQGRIDGHEVGTSRSGTAKLSEPGGACHRHRPRTWFAGEPPT